jgi:cytochrome c oxidase subunit 4
MSVTLRLVLVWAALLALLALTVSASFLPLGAARLAVSYGIATAKAALVLWFFMELRGDKGLTRLAGLAGFAWIALLFTLVAADYLTRTVTSAGAVR